MPARLLLAAAAVLGAGLATALGLAAPPPPGFAYGVAAGEMTPTSARLWTRAPRPGTVTLTVVGDGDERTFALTATRTTDLTAQLTVRDLRPGTTYRYSFAQGGSRSGVGRFET